MFKGIPNSDRWRDIRAIDYGWSGDEKYYVNIENAPYLLRISPAHKAPRRKKEFETLCKLPDLGPRMSRAIQMGFCEDGSVYLLLTWVPGKPAEDVVPSLPPSLQADLGRQAGLIARALHALPAANDTPLWEQRFSAKMTKKVEQYRACPHQLPSCDDFMQYVLQNGHLLAGRPSSFQHGDFHIGNMVVDEHNQLGVIDFDRIDWGDPWEEYNRIPWCVARSEVFSSALLHAYFGGDPPALFWQLLALYIASNQLSAIPWAIDFGQDEVDTMIAQCKFIRTWYDGAYGLGAPNWYKKHQ